MGLGVGALLQGVIRRIEAGMDLDWHPSVLPPWQVGGLPGLEVRHHVLQGLGAPADGTAGASNSAA